MASAAEYGSVSEGRAHLRDLLDAAAAGVPASLRRDRERFAMVDADRLRRFLASIGSRAQAVAEDGGWSVFIPGLPVAADGVGFDEAVAEMVDALREYASDWIDRLSTAPNHMDNWGLVQMVSLSTDEQLAQWITGGTLDPA